MNLWQSARFKYFSTDAFCGKVEPSTDSVHKNKDSSRIHSGGHHHEQTSFHTVPLRLRRSFLRPARLKEARQKFSEQAISADELKTVEDDCIRELVAKQKAAGYHVITDGEFRRATWHLDFMWGFQGIAHEKTDKGVCFHGEPALIDDTWLTGPLSAENHPFVEHFKFVHALEDENTVAKQTIPAPAQFFQQMILPDNIERTRKVYATDEALIEAIAAGYRTVICDLYAAGCRNLQFDDCTWGVLAAGGKKGGKFAYVEGSDLKKLAEQFVTVNNLAIEGSPDDLVINTHVCRGNYHSVYFASGAYDPIATRSSRVRTSTPTTSSSTTSAPAALRVSRMSRRARRSCSASSRRSVQSSRTRQPSSPASTRRPSTCHSRIST